MRQARRAISAKATKTATITDVDGNGETGLGDIINYTIAIENKGTESLKNFTVTDTLVDAAGNSLSLNATPTSSDPDLLAPGGVKTYVATIQQLKMHSIMGELKINV